MSKSSHLEELRRRHEELSRQVEEAKRNLGVDGLEIAEMKKMKLKLKEEIVRLADAEAA